MCLVNFADEMHWEFPEPYSTLISSVTTNSTSMICVFMSNEDFTPQSFIQKIDLHCEDSAFLSMVVVFADPLPAGPSQRLNNETPSRPQSLFESTAPDQGRPPKIETNESFFTASPRSHNVSITVPPLDPQIRFDPYLGLAS
jgi:hypothetical protein